MFKTVVVCDNCGTEKTTGVDVRYSSPLGWSSTGYWNKDPDTAYNRGWRIRKYWRHDEDRTLHKNKHMEYDHKNYYTGEIIHVSYTDDNKDSGHILHLCPECVTVVDA